MGRRPGGRWQTAVVVVLACCLVPGVALPKATPAPAVEIHSVSPSVAGRGSLVTVAGKGFGGRNVEVTVDGDAAAVLSATGNRITFRVPPLAGPGVTEVRATNPGGHSGRAGLEVLFDGVATPVLDEASAVSETIGRAGGSLGAGGLTLSVPPGALSEDVAITLTPLLALEDSPFEGSLIGGAKLEPEGLAFLLPAMLTLPLPAGISPVDVLGFHSAGDGTELHLVPRTVTGGTIAVPLFHFSTAGASSGGAAAGASASTHVPSAAEARALARIAAAGPACEAELVVLIFDGPGCTHLKQEIGRALSAWYRDTVKPGLAQAVGAPSFEVDVAIREWLNWSATVHIAMNSLAGVCDNLQAECDEAGRLAGDAVVDLAVRRLQNCTGTSLASQFRDVSRIADYMQASELNVTGKVLPGNVPFPDANGLLHACAHLVIEVLDFPAVAALRQHNTLDGKVSVDVFSGPNRTDVPFTLRVDGSVVATGAGGTFRTTIRPTSAPLNVLLAAEADETSLKNNNFTASMPLARPARDRIDLGGRGPGDTSFSDTVSPLQPSQSVTFRVRVAGDRMDGGTVTFALNGPGSLGATGGTTDAQGEVSFTYDAPAAPAAAAATVTATFDGTSDSIALTITPPAVTVTLSPGNVTVVPGQQVQFAATVANAADPSVGWGASGGTIDQSGLFTAGSAVGTFAVSAVSVEDPSAAGFATVEIVSPTLPGLYEGGTCCGGVALGQAVIISRPLADGSFLLTDHNAFGCLGRTDWGVHFTGSSFAGVQIGFCRNNPGNWRIEGTVSGGVLSFTITAFDEHYVSVVGMRRRS